MTPTETGSTFKLSKMIKFNDVVMTLVLFGIIALMILPVPVFMLDVLLATSVCLSVLVLLLVIYVRDPTDFSVFPTLLLGMTLFRLGLNIASTRRILLDGYAGDVIESFGNFVVQGNYVVGAVVFLILVVINFTVITKGSERVAEVGARFTLDAMPGKQMSIDAELNSGLIDETEARERREKLQKESDFYGSMDGAVKFVKGDAAAGILITLINIVGGITIGMAQRGMPLLEALQTYTLLSIGDGLVSQIPAIIISVGAGILVTRSSEETDFSDSISKQFIIHPKAAGSAAAMLGLFAVIPGMPFVPFFVLSAACGTFAYLSSKKMRKGVDPLIAAEAAKLNLPDGAAPLKQNTENEEEEAKPGSVADLCKMIKSDAFAIELGYGLLSLADKKSGGDLLERITGVRQKFAREMGIIMPPIAVRDNLELENSEYRFLVRNKEIGKSSLIPNRWLAMNVSNSNVELKGVPTVEPVFNLDAVWIADEERKNAELNGYTVVDASSVMITHLSETVREHAHLILDREDIQKIVEVVRESNPTLIEELLPDIVNVGTIQRILQNLLKERIAIKNISVILETISDVAQYTKNPDELSEHVRRRLGIYFIEELECQPGFIQALTLDPQLEQILVSRVKHTQFEVGLMMDPRITEHMLNELTPRLTSMVEQGFEPIIVITAELRLAFKRFFEPSFPRLTVLAYQEIPNATQISNFGIITLPPDIQFTPVAQQQAAEANPSPALTNT